MLDNKASTGSILSGITGTCPFDHQIDDQNNQNQAKHTQFKDTKEYLTNLLSQSFNADIPNAVQPVQSKRKGFYADYCKSFYTCNCRPGLPFDFLTSYLLQRGCCERKESPRKDSCRRKSPAKICCKPISRCSPKRKQRRDCISRDTMKTCPRSFNHVKLRETCENYSKDLSRCFPLESKTENSSSSTCEKPCSSKSIRCEHLTCKCKPVCCENTSCCKCKPLSCENTCKPISCENTCKPISCENTNTCKPNIVHMLESNVKLHNKWCPPEYTSSIMVLFFIVFVVYMMGVNLGEYISYR